MHFSHAFVAPNGARTILHQLARIDISAGKALAVVSSYASEEATMISWQDSYAIPLAALSSEPELSVANWLIGTEGPFAGGLITDEGEVDLQSAQTRARAAVKQKRDEVEWGGCATPLGRVNTDPTSQRKIGGAVQMAIILGDAFTIDWRMEDDSVVTHDKNAMINMGVLAGQHVSLCQANKNTLDAAVEAAESVEDVEAVDISLGWPA